MQREVDQLFDVFYTGEEGNYHTAVSEPAPTSVAPPSPPSPPPTPAATTHKNNHSGANYWTWRPSSQPVGYLALLGALALLALMWFHRSRGSRTLSQQQLRFKIDELHELHSRGFVDVPTFVPPTAPQKKNTSA